MNYLALCQDFVSEVGIEGGTGLASVVGQTGEYGNVVRWIRDADAYIDNLHPDWKFLWVKLTGKTLTIGSDVVPIPTAPSVINNIDLESMWINAGTTTAKRLLYLPWVDFRKLYDLGSVKETQEPSFFSIKPDRSMVLDTLSDDIYPITYEYWEKHTDLAANADEPAIPERFHRLIIVKAKLAYAAREDAPEIKSDAAAEYTDLLEKLESQEWPGNEYATMASASNASGAGDIVVSVE